MKYLRPSLLLSAVAFLAYGLLTPQQGFYWDDLPISWIRYEFGSAASMEYFSGKRPVWGVLYQITGWLIPQVPAFWQVFALVMLVASAVVFYVLLEKLWNKPGLALAIALLFLVYPGFNQHWAAYLYSHFYVVLFFFLFSLLCMVQSVQEPNQYWRWTITSLIFSALNLWMMEYYFVLDLIRVGLILITTRTEQWTLRERLFRTLKLCTPYLILFTLAVVSRLFISTDKDYPMVLPGRLRAAPLETLKELFNTIALTLRLALKDAWLQVFDFPEVAAKASVMTLYYIVIVAVAVITALGFFYLSRRNLAQPIRNKLIDAAWLFGLGILAVLLSGWPYWLIDFQPSLAWPASRFALSFTIGVSLLFGGLISFIPWERVQVIFFVALISLAAGKQYLTSQDYIQDWQTQKDLFWQMTWRAPAIKPDTLILLNEGGLKYYADNSLSAALNWIYAPENHSRHIDYVLFYPTTRLKTGLPKIAPNIPVQFDYIIGDFNGNTSQTIAMYYAPPGCLRILDSEVEHLNRMIPETSLMRFATTISDPSLITNETQAQMPRMYGPEPAHDFCYYFEKADLARQLGDWNTVVKLGETALSMQGHPFNPAEQFVFIEGYAHKAEWSKAVELSQKAYESNPQLVGPMLCRLWRRIGDETAQSEERSAALEKIQTMGACNP
jgi:hypothetical protein